jgi:DNA repair exonuclease SbcCD ATPase subunit
MHCKTKRQKKKIKKSTRGGAPKLSSRAKSTKKKLADIKRGEKALQTKQKKLATAQNKLSKAELKVTELMEKLNVVENEVQKANDNLDYYKRQLSYSDLKETD